MYNSRIQGIKIYVCRCKNTFRFQRNRTFPDATDPGERKAATVLLLQEVRGVFICFYGVMLLSDGLFFCFVHQKQFSGGVKSHI